MWKKVYSVQADVRKVDRNFNGLKRNITGIAGRVRGQSKELDKYDSCYFIAITRRDAAATHLLLNNKTPRRTYRCMGT